MKKEISSDAAIFGCKVFRLSSYTFDTARDATANSPLSADIPHYSNDKTFFLLLFIGSKLNKSVGLLLTYSSSKLLFFLRASVV